MKKVLVVVTILAIALVSSVAMAGIATTRHNLSTSSSGSNTYKSTDETQICIFCHTPHNAEVASGPLWNRSALTTVFAMYTIQTHTLPQPDGTALSNASKGCMSCHDGATSLNALVNKSGLVGADPTMSGGLNLITGAGNLGTSLSNDHPVAVVYNTAYASLKNPDNVPSAVTKVTTSLGQPTGVSGTSKVQCESCHDVHISTTASFLRFSNSGSALCLACHDK